ncbi:MAG: 50S ribosome-binding GTPase, partial [Limnochordia bacterium]|nr:50S ribosome-binding GTPase [Limnochordia bacterium]
MNMQDTPRGNRSHIVFVGPGNVGKSSLINAIADQEVSLVSEILGTT